MEPAPADHPAHQVVESVWRLESARLMAGLVRLVRDVGLAEELAQEALVVALEKWPSAGVPDNPGAWLMTTARNRGLDHLRRQQLLTRKHQELGHTMDALQDERAGRDVDARLDDPVGDDLLRLMFICCHPVLSTDGRVALTLRMLGGLSTAEIARAFLVPETTLAQRLVRAKKTLADKQVPFEVPRGAELQARVSSVLEVLYLVFNEGYSASGGEDWMRPGLCREALRLCRVMVGLMPEASEVHGLLALMELQHSRAEARAAADGTPILLLEQDRSRWDQGAIRRGLAALDEAAKRADDAPGPYLLQAALAAVHARAPTAADTDWARLVTVYDVMLGLHPSPVVELNRAVAVGMAHGPQAGLDLVDTLRNAPALAGYHLLPSVRADLLMKLHRFAEARDEWERAASLTQNTREVALLRERAATCEERARSSDAPPEPNRRTAQR